MIPGAPLIAITIWTQVLNAILLPIVLICMMIIVNNKEIMEQYTNNSCTKCDWLGDYSDLNSLKCIPSRFRGRSGINNVNKVYFMRIIEFVKENFMRYLVPLFLCSSLSFAQTYDAYFTSTTMRVDYYHIGTKGQEQITLDKVYEESAWPGSKMNLLDTLDLGSYFVKVSDLQTKVLLYSRGYSTVFGEWQTTEEAINGTWRTFHETVRFPFPKQKVIVSFYSRDTFVAAGEKMAFREIFSTIIDPNSPTLVDRAKRQSPYKVFDIMINGPIEKKVDILILGDGYAKSDMEKFRKDAKHFAETLFLSNRLRNMNTISIFAQ